ncbi:hypothetical protein [Pseudanabaena sp. UWO311]|uniref:hypothetical protein n=1 Tax=Pseudanabaena sp. UWO311 TaxID=2487337 RepID=UPI001681AD55|nr:hypothetical protein [Pseudanabaena sp. UWO311]
MIAPQEKSTNQRSPIHSINSDRLFISTNSDRHSKKQINQRSPIHPHKQRSPSQKAT